MIKKTQNVRPAEVLRPFVKESEEERLNTVVEPVASGGKLTVVASF